MTRLPLLVALATLVNLASAGEQEKQSSDSGQQNGKVIAGWVEKVSLPGKSFQLHAKLDTGAKTSSIHAIDIQPIIRDGKRWTRFTLVLEDTESKIRKITMQQPVVRRVRIKEHYEERDERMVVELPLCFNGNIHQVEFSLKNRVGFNYPVLLGRRFLRETALVDSEHTFLTEPNCS